MPVAVGRGLCARQDAANAGAMFDSHKVLGVLGGMPGPLASAQFMVRLTLLTPATRDQDHIPAVLWSDPRVPDRTVGRLSGGADPLPWLLRGIEGLQHAGCGAIAIPCNTAHGLVRRRDARSGPHPDPAHRRRRRPQSCSGCASRAGSE